MFVCLLASLRQWDQIGLHLKVERDKFSYKRSQNIWQLFGLFLKLSLFKLKLLCATSRAILGKIGQFTIPPFGHTVRRQDQRLK